MSAQQFRAGRDQRGLRERNKDERLQRIKTAARAVFLQKGYDEATMRQIAHRAGVAVGTLFNYAANKRDLLFLAYNDEQEQIVEVIAKGIRPSGSLLTDLVSYFRFIYDVFASEVEFTRFILREQTFYTSGSQAAHSLKGREAVITGIEKLITDARARGQINSREDDATIARFIFGVFQVEVRRWLAGPAPKASEGLRGLRRMMKLAVEGIGTAEP